MIKISLALAVAVLVELIPNSLDKVVVLRAELINNVKVLKFQVEKI